MSKERRKKSTFEPEAFIMFNFFFHFEPKPNRDVVSLGKGEMKSSNYSLKALTFIRQSSYTCNVSGLLDHSNEVTTLMNGTL